MDIKRILQNDFILGQGTCLICTQNIDSAKVLDGIEFFDDDFSLAMMMEPLARLAVIIIGNISGVKPTPTL